MNQTSRHSGIRNFFEALEGVERIVLTTHLNADGDGTGCQAALVELLRERGHEVRIVNPTPFPDNFRFLLGDPDPVLDAGSEAAAQWCREADLCIVVDTAEIPRLGRVRPMVEALPTVVIDHHPEGTRPIPGVPFVDTGAAAAGELVLDLLREAGGPWTRPAVEGLYVAIMTDTGSFRFSNTSPGVHRAAAELIERGAEPDALHRRVYGSAPIRRFQLLRETLKTLERSEDGGVAWMTVPPEVYDSLGCDPADLEGLTDYPRSIRGVEVAILFRVVRDGIKISFRSNGEFDVNQLARTFDGGGHTRAAGALVPGPMDEARARVVDATIDAVARWER